MSLYNNIVVHHVDIEQEKTVIDNNKPNVLKWENDLKMLNDFYPVLYNYSQSHTPALKYQFLAHGI